MGTWKTRKTMLDNGEVVNAIAPYIISSSRSTDIPAFYMDWFMYRLIRGYSVWQNPFNKDVSQVVSYANTKYIVFWSKNPAPLLQWLPILRKMKIGVCVQYTLNNYKEEVLEPNVPSVMNRVTTFIQLSRELGKNNVVWRFDPLVLTETTGVDDLVNMVGFIGDTIAKHTSKLVFSYADIGVYKRVRQNLEHDGVRYIEWDNDSMVKFAQKIVELNKAKGWGLRLATCGETANLAGIEHNKCVDDELVIKEKYRDKELMDFLGVTVCKRENTLFGDAKLPEGSVPINNTFYYIKSKSVKDGGQRKACGCMVSKDVGEYNTCMHLCKYCYANASADTAIANYEKHLGNPFSETITGN